MKLVQMTHWRLDYIMNEISIGALTLLVDSLGDETDGEFSGLAGAARAMRKH